VERLKSRGLNASIIHATAKSNTEVFSYLRDLITSQNIVLPDNERMIDELASLEQIPTWYGFKVEAAPGCHDDCADAVANCAWSLASRSESQWKDFFDVVEGE